MALAEVEELQLGVIRELCLLPKESLGELCDYLIQAGAELEHVSSKGRAALITLISCYIQREELEELEDRGMAELLHLQDKITELQAVCNASAAKQAEGQQKKKASTQNGRDNKEKRDTKNYGYNRQVTQNTAHNPPPHHWHKDFKIAGQIGEPVQKDKLTFSSLARQIEHGLSKGFPELEIVDAVIRAIAPGMQLCSYLEGKVNLTLPTLRRILRSHYQEKSATNLYTQLTSEVQGLKETPQNFLIRTLDLRQKILFASQESESGLQYDPGLVQRMFLHTVLTGLQNDNSKDDLQPYLEQADISDELLLKRMNTACAHETERQMKKKWQGNRNLLLYTQHSQVMFPLKRMKNQLLTKILKFPLSFSPSLRRLNLR